MRRILNAVAGSLGEGEDVERTLSFFLFWVERSAEVECPRFISTTEDLEVLYRHRFNREVELRFSWYRFGGFKISDAAKEFFSDLRRSHIGEFLGDERRLRLDLGLYADFMQRHDEGAALPAYRAILSGSDRARPRRLWGARSRIRGEEKFRTAAFFLATHEGLAPWFLQLVACELEARAAAQGSGDRDAARARVEALVASKLAEWAAQKAEQ